MDRSLIIIVVLGALLGVAMAQDMSGSGSGDMVQYCPNSTCASSGGVCRNDTDTCQCPTGKNNDLYDKYLCKECELGYYGENCAMSCADNCGGEGHYKSCDAVNGTCVCNSCWMGTNCGTQVAGEEGYQCFIDYLESEDKDLEEYGGEIPQPHEDKLYSLAQELVGDPDIAVVQDASAMLEVISREDARDLARLSFVLRNQGSSDYDNAVSHIKDKVKRGDYRATLIIDESDEETGKVTVNV